MQLEGIVSCTSVLSFGERSAQDSFYGRDFLLESGTFALSPEFLNVADIKYSSIRNGENFDAGNFTAFQNFWQLMNDGQDNEKGSRYQIF